jgi:zinc protease
MMWSAIKCYLLLMISVLVVLPTGVFAAQYQDITGATLKNGLRVVIVRNTLAPVATVQINYLAGSDEAPPGFPGMAHAQEHMMFRGSPGLSAGQLSAIIAALGGEFNADTEQTVTQYFQTVPAQYLDIALHIEAIRMRGALDSQKLWERERGAIEQEVVQDLSNPEYLLETRLLAALFAGTPYEHDALGTRTSFDKTTGMMLKKFHEDWYAPNNSVLVVVGDVNPDVAMASIRRLFDPIPSRPLPARPVFRFKPLKSQFFEMETDLPYGLALVAYRLPGYDNPDFAAGQVLSDVLGSQRGNLFGLVPEGKALSADFDDIPLPRAAAGYATAAFPKGDDGRALITMLKGIIGDYVKNGFPPELVEAAKRREIAAGEFRKNSISGLASAWSQAIAVEGRDSPDADIEAIRKVSVADVNRVAREYLVNETAVTAILTPRPSGKPVTAAVPRGKESFAPRRTKSVNLPAWAKKVLAEPSEIPMTKGRSVFTLANGLRLIIQHTDISKTVSIYGRIKNRPELEQPKGKEGVADVLDGMFPYGTTSLDRLAFQKALDDIAADESAGTSFSLQVLREYAERGVQLLADNVLQPAFPERAFKVVRQETAGELAGKLQSPSYLSHRALLKALYPKGDPTHRQATPETVSALSLEDVRTYYRKVFRPDLTTIVVIGDISPEKAVALIKKYFGKWRIAGPEPGTDLPPVPLNKTATVRVPDSSRIQDEVSLVQTLGLNRFNSDYYPLQLGLHVLSGAFYATRLYHDLREQAGLVYTVDAFLQASRTRSIFGIEYGCDPENVSKARSVIERNLREMQQKTVSAVELRQARTLLLREQVLSGESTAGIAHNLLELSLEGLPLDEPQIAAKRYRNISEKQIKAAFSKWIRPTGFVQVTQGPNPK